MLGRQAISPPFNYDVTVSLKMGLQVDDLFVSSFFHKSSILTVAIDHLSAGFKVVIYRILLLSYVSFNTLTFITDRN